MAAAHGEPHKKHENEPEPQEEQNVNPEPAKQAEKQPQLVTIDELELQALKSELVECKDKYLRVLAETENARKRMQKEKQELIQYSIQNVIVDFLNPIDHMENALKYAQQMSEEVKHWALGFQMILTQFKDVLAVNGVETFVSVGKMFDPHCHEAIDTVETEEAAPGIVIEESLKGYKMGDRVIRPARVLVAKALQQALNASGDSDEKTQQE